MASNKKLIAEIKELSESLGLEVDTSEMKNKALTNLLSDLKAKKRDSEIESQADIVEIADNETPEKEIPAPAPALENPILRVAKGKAITSTVGILSAGDEVKESYFPNTDVVENLISLGYVTRGA